MIDVAIIGAGPTGLVLANLLGRRGVRTLVLEKQPKPYPQPRAIHFDGEIMRVFQSTGLAEEVLAHTTGGIGMLFKNRDGETLVDWSRSPDIGPMGWRESYRFYQPGLEQALADGLDRFPHVDLRRGADVTDVAIRDDHAALTLATGETVTARYAVGCDGALSLTRQAIGEGMEDLGFRQTWLVVDVLLKRPRPDLGDHSVQVCDPDAPATYVRGAGNWRRWEFRVGSTEPPDEGEIWRRLNPWITTADASLERSAVYTFRSLVARRWRRGPLLIAGDAAHQTPPFMGQGMCAGVRDAANLSWKLALALGGHDVVDTYQSERAPNARQFIDMAVRLGRMISQTASGEIPQGRMVSIWPALGEGLGPRDAVSGALAPQPLVGEVRADDLARGRFYALARAECAASIPVFTEAARWLKDNDIFGAIVRPDGYVLSAAPDKPTFLAEMAETQRLLSLTQSWV